MLFEGLREDQDSIGLFIEYILQVLLLLFGTFLSYKVLDLSLTVVVNGIRDYNKLDHISQTLRSSQVFTIFKARHIIILN